MEKTRSYSGLFIISPEKEDTIKDVAKSINSVISDNSGKITKENIIGKKALAYPIKKKGEGIHFEIAFTALPESISNIMRQFRINTDILRTLIDKEG